MLVAVAAGITYYIFQQQRLRIPILEEKPFELKAEFETAQAVVPGQGQTIRVAGVRVGDVSDVELEDGVGVVTFQIDREFLPIYKDATLLMRPTTGLKDMFFQLDPGTNAAGEYEEGETVPVSNTAPDVNLDEVLEALDSDTQAYLQVLLVGAGKGLEGRDEDLGKVLGGLGPINEDFEKLNIEVATRQQNVRNLVHNFNVLTGRIAQADDDLVELVSTSNSALGAIAEQDPSVRRAVQLLGPTLTQAESTLNQVADFAAVLGPTFNDLRPFARNLDEANGSLETLARSATPVIENEIRPFVRSAREPVPDLRRAADRYSSAAPRLTVVGKKLNKLTNMAAQQPRHERRRRRAGPDRYAEPRRGLPVLGRLARPQRQLHVQHGRRQRPVPPDLLHRRLQPARQHPHRRHGWPAPDGAAARWRGDQRPAPAGARPDQRRRHAVRARRACAT